MKNRWRWKEVIRETQEVSSTKDDYFEPSKSGNYECGASSTVELQYRYAHNWIFFPSHLGLVANCNLRNVGKKMLL